MKCPRCGADNQRSAKACWQCYSNLTEAGAVAPLATTATAMPRPASPPATAGAPLEMPAAAGIPQAPTSPQALTRPPRAAQATGKRLPLVPIIAVLVIAGVAGGGFLFLKGRAGDPGKVVKEFYEALGRKDYDAMAKCCNSATAARIQQRKQLLDANPQLKAFLDGLKVDNVQIGEITVEGDTAKVKVTPNVTISFMGQNITDNKERTIPVVKENGEWKMDASSAMPTLGNILGGGTMGGRRAGGGKGKGR